MEAGSHSNTSNGQRKLVPSISLIGACDYGVGGAVGWGSFVVTGNQYLLEAGPLGSVLGLLFGTILMPVIARNYANLMTRFSGVGGAYTYARSVLELITAS